MESLLIRGISTRCWKGFPSTLRELVELSRQHGDRDYLVYEDERLTYRQAYAQTCAVARYLVNELQVRKGDRIAIAARNYPEWPLAFWASVCIGAIAVPLNAWWKTKELVYGLSDSGTTVLFADAERAEMLRDEFAALNLKRTIVIRANARTSAEHERFETLVADASTDERLPPADVDPEDDATIFYTSGTTGSPKGALGTHRNMCTNVGSSAFVKARVLLRKGESLPDPAAPRPQMVTLISVPLFHVTGSHSLLAAGTHSGNKLVLMYRWNPERALELIEREGVTNFGGVPAMAWQVIESPDLPRRDTSSVVGVGYGGAPAAPELVRRIQEVFPAASPSNGYGLTETSALTSSNGGVDYQRKPHSVGPCVATCDVKVVAEDGSTLGAGEAGELFIRGPNIVKGYWNKPEATAEVFTDGWLHSGDVASIDEEGFITILDRAKDMLIRGGENIYCVEVENVLYQHPAILDAAVIGLPHRVLGEEVGAVVQVKAGHAVTVEQLQSHAAEYLAAFKVPVRIELRDAPLPRNANGKILKRQLKAEISGA